MANLKPLLCNILMENPAKDIKEEVDKVLTVLTESFQDVYSEYHRLKIFQEMGHIFLLSHMLLVIDSTISSFKIELLKKLFQLLLNLFP